MATTTKRALRSIKQRQELQRDTLWPDAEEWLWDRNLYKGFATIPKTFPHILRAMNELSEKGKPLAETYMGLWCETWDNSMVNAGKHMELALAAGFGGQRVLYTWSERIKLLHKLHFIDVQPGSAGPISTILIFNPHYIIRWHWHYKTGIQTATYNALLQRAIDIGAKDMTTKNFELPSKSPVDVKDWSEFPPPVDASE